MRACVECFSLFMSQRALEPLRAVAFGSGTQLLSRVSAAFQAQQPLFRMDLIANSNNALIKNSFLKQKLYDLALVTVGPTAADYRDMPSLMYLPILGTAVVFTHHLPPSVSNGLN